MLIRLVPSSSQPTVLFKLVFENLSETLQTPTAWVNHLAALDSDDLEIPELLHALDKAVGVVSLCDEVVFNMIDKKIKCVLCDGEVEEWDIGSEYFGKFVEIAHQRTADLIRRLDGVIDDVNESAAEIERERKRAEERKEQQRIKEEQELEAAKPQETSTMCTSGRKKKLGHKKQRSLLMNLVSSLIPLSLNSPRPSSYPSSRSPSPASSTRSTHAEKFVTQTTSAPPTLSRSVTLPTPRSRNSRPVSVSSLSSPLTTIESPLSSPTVVIVAPPPPPPLSPRALRRRARSTLVDAFRIYVLPELTKRVRCSRIAGSVVNAPVPFYGSDTSAPYYPWIVSSMLKRVDTRLSEIGRELQEEMDAIGIELSALPLNVLAGIGLGPIASPTSFPVQVPHQSLHSLSSSDGDTRSHSESEGDATDSEAGDSMSDVTLVGSAVLGSAEGLPVVYQSPKPISYPEISALSNMYTRASSPFEKAMLAQHARPEVPLPESLNELLVQHNELSSAHLRLAHLLLTSHARAAAAATDISQRETVLEVRSRRRAWLNRALQILHSASTEDNVTSWSGAMSSPFRPSGLAKYSYTSEEWDCDPYHYLNAFRLTPLSPLPTLMTDVYPNPFDSEADGSYSSYVYTHRRRKSPSETSFNLFSVSEEETVVDFTTGKSTRHKDNSGHNSHLDVEIDTDDEDSEEDGDDTDVDILADIGLDASGGGDNDALQKSSRPSLQNDTSSTTAKPNSPGPTSSTSLSICLDAKIAKGAPVSDPFQGPEDKLGSLALVAAANLSKHIKCDTKTDIMATAISRNNAWFTAVNAASEFIE